MTMKKLIEESLDASQPIVVTIRQGDRVHRSVAECALIVTADVGSPATVAFMVRDAQNTVPYLVASALRTTNERDLLTDTFLLALAAAPIEVLGSFTEAMRCYQQFQREGAQHGEAEGSPEPDAGGEAEPRMRGPGAPEDDQEPPKEGGG
jgi:hypothetical protein